MSLTQSETGLDYERFVQQGGNQAMAFPWANLQSRFLDSLDAVAKAQIFDLSAKMVPALDAWAARHPLIRRVRIWPLSISVAAAARFSSVDALVSTAKVSLWVFTLDDVFDEELIQGSELMRRAEQYKGIALDGEGIQEDDSLGIALSDVRDDLARYPLFHSIGEEWGNALCGTIDGMIQENNWRLSYQREGATALPTYYDYVANGLYSIGGPPHIWAALITTDDESTPQHLDHLRAMEHIASACVRLANDLQSHEKEMSEGKINALVILARELQENGMAASEAYEAAEGRVYADIAHGLERLAELQTAAVSKTGWPEAVTADIARFVCEFYTQHDYHTFVLEGRGKTED